LALSIISAFVLPARLTNPVRTVQGLFAPVARPTRAIAGALHARLAPRQRDSRDVTDVKDENERLRAQVVSLTGQLEELKRINEDRNRLGDIRPLCTPFPVIGSDGGVRDSLAISATTRDGVAESMPVLYGEGVVGTIERVGPAGAQVRLVTDPDFRARARFYYFAPGDPKAYPLNTTPPLIKGAGDGRMLIVNVPVKETALQPDPELRKVQAGDMVALDDPDWPRNLSGHLVGEIESMAPLRNAPLYAEIRVRPILNLSQLREVMVMNRLGS
jgi:cell shape-determining protein MreC